MVDLSKNILEKPARRWRLVDEYGRIGDTFGVRSVYKCDDGQPNDVGVCHRAFTRLKGEPVSELRTVVHGQVLKFEGWYDLLLESGQNIDFRHVTGLVDGIGVSELWAVDRMACRDDQPAMSARKQFTPAQRAVVAEWHRRELKYLSAT